MEVERRTRNRRDVPRIPSPSTLHSAAIEGDKKVIELLLDQGVDVNARCGFAVTRQSRFIPLSQTPLHMAAHKGEREVVELLLTRGADVDARDFLDTTALRQAAYFGHTEVVELLLSCGANIEARHSRYRRTVLHVVVCRGNLALVETLLRRGADIKATDLYQYTALHLAVLHGNVALVESLLWHGADIEAVDVYQRTALYMAAKDGYVEMVRVLFWHGANIKAASMFSGFAALQVAALNGHVAVVEELLRNDNEVKDHNVALHLAAGCGHKEVVKAFRRHGVDMRAKDANGCTASGLLKMASRGKRLTKGRLIVLD
ncbi:MAG: hypothetical protein M1813_009694 [Trichoglossum hirsutum]|nr:MAG: hypothetical protein M1813_009694 [Trichoglossum hirsutum]